MVYMFKVLYIIMLKELKSGQGKLGNMVEGKIIEFEERWLEIL